MQEKNSKNIWVNVKVLSQILKNKLVTEFAFCYKIKSMFVSSTILNYTHAKMSRVLNISQTHVSRIIKRCIQVGLAKYKNKILSIVNFEKFANIKSFKSDRIKINILQEDNLKNIRYKLKFVLLHYKYDRQQIKCKVCNKKMIDSYYNAKTEKKQKQISKKINKTISTVVFSYNYISKLFHCSKSTAFDTIQKFRENGWLDCNITHIIHNELSKKQFAKFKNTEKYKQMCKNGYYFHPSGFILKKITSYKINKNETQFIIKNNNKNRGVKIISGVY